jgi:small GTP-binding protein
LVHRFIEGQFDERYLSTLGAKVNRKSLILEHKGSSVDMKLLIWDIAGGEKFDMIMRSYYNGAAGAIVVCDLTRPDTIENLHRYVQDFWSINPNAPFVFVGNKVDLISDLSTIEPMLAQITKQYQAAYFISSAKSGENVESLFVSLGTALL